MTTSQEVDLYLDTAITEGLSSSKGKLRFYMETLFSGIDFKNKRVLDIGGGFGLYSFYAACRGAKDVLCLEPEDAGSTSGVTGEFHKLSALLGKRNVAISPASIQELEPEGNNFDVILLHNSINHLDETACMHLQQDPRSRVIYQEILAKIFSLSNQGAHLIVCDCSRCNFFGSLGIRNPFSPTIEWHKHQKPGLWAQLLGEAGFVNPRIRWSSPNAMRGVGRALTGNKIMAFFFTSHFCLTMVRPSR